MNFKALNFFFRLFFIAVIIGVAVTFFGKCAEKNSTSLIFSNLDSLSLKENTPQLKVESSTTKLNFLEVVEDVFEETQTHESYSKDYFNSFKIHSYTLLLNKVYTLSEYQSISLFILYCSLKIPSTF